jgi:hypothetical protein
MRSHKLAFKIERGLRRQEAFLSYRMMRILTNEIRKLKKANDFLCRKLKEKKKRKIKVYEILGYEYDGKTAYTMVRDQKNNRIKKIKGIL